MLANFRLGHQGVGLRALTAAFQRRLCSSTSACAMCGLKRRSSFHARAASPVSFHTPAAMPGQQRRAERRRLDERGPHDLAAEHVGLELHQQIVGRGAAVDLERAQRHARVALHRAEQIGDLQRDALEHRARQVRRVVPRVSPVMMPRASGRQCGAPSPASAGTTTTPPESGTDARQRLDLATPSR